MTYENYENDRACTNFIFGIAEYFFEGNIKNKLALVNVSAVLYDGSTDIKLCVSYILLLLNEQYVSWLFRTKCFETKFNLSCFIFSLLHEHLFSPGLIRATRLIETSCFEKITAFVIQTMLVTFPLVQMNKARREVGQ